MVHIYNKLKTTGKIRNIKNILLENVRKLQPNINGSTNDAPEEHDM